MTNEILVRCVFSFFTLVCFVLLSLTFSSQLKAQTQNLVFTDDTGQEIHLTAHPQRIISLSPSITENLFAIGLGDRVVGVSRFSDYPQAAQNLPIISDYQNIDLEAVIKLKPDIIISWDGGQSPSQLNAIKQLGIPIFYQRVNTLADIPLSLMRLSRMAGNERQVSPMIAQAYMDIPLKSQAEQPTLSAFYQVWSQPLMTINGKSWISDVLLRCGARNLFYNAPIAVPTVNIEDVLQYKPDVILTATPRAIADGSLDFWQEWPNIPAIQHGGLVYTDTDMMNRSTLRTLSATKQLCYDLSQLRQRNHSKL